MTTVTALCDATIFTGEAFVENRALLIENGKVLDIAPDAGAPAGAETVSCAGKILAPGFIDAQVNGGGNVLLNNTPTAETCLAIAAAHRRRGTTRLLLTCITDHAETMQQAVHAVREARSVDKSILGAHVEGPHLDFKGRGVHKAEYIRPCTDQDMQFYRREGGEIMLITVAPETVPPEQIKKLRDQGVIVSLGHTQASPEQIRAALAAGASGFTHLYNGMGGVSARALGPAAVALEDRESWCGIIADGHHVSADMIRLAIQTKPPGKMFLVSDAMPPSATDQPKPFQLYGETIRVEDGRCVNGEGRLAGAVLTMAEAVRHCVRKVGLKLGDALRMASTYPAAFLGVENRLGKLLPGYEADIVMLNTNYGADAVWRAGERIT